MEHDPLVARVSRAAQVMGVLGDGSGSATVERKKAIVAVARQLAEVAREVLISLFSKAPQRAGRPG